MIANIVIWSIAIAIIALLSVLLAYLLVRGVRYIDIGFLVKPPEVIRAGGGVGPLIFNSFYLLVLSMLITLPLGVGAGVYLSEYARQNEFTRAIRLSTQALSSLPSIVVGLFGLLVFVNATGWGYSLMAGALALTMLNLPVVVSITEQSIRAVPKDFREASLALGATTWETVWNVVLPSALPGILTGAIIAAGRAFGEAAALLYTSGMSSPPLDFTDWNPAHPISPLNPFRPAETLAVHIYKINSEGLLPDLRRIADGSAAILVLVVLAFDLLSRYLVTRLVNKT